MKRTHLFLWLACLVCVGIAPARHLSAKDTQTDFDQAVANLQSDPDNQILRRRTIQLAHGLESRPKKSEEQAILEAKAVYLAKSAASTDDYLAAVEAYKKASLLAPWDGNLYFNQGVLEQQGDLPQDAIRDFKLYLLAEPDAADHDQVLARLGKLEALQDKKETAATNAATQKTWAVHQTVGGIIAGLGICGIIAGGVELIVSSVSTPGGTFYTQSQGPQVYQGTNYNTLYQGDYYTAASYNQFISDQRSGMTLGWTLLGVGAAVTVVGIVVAVSGPSAPPVVQQGLFNYKDGRLAMGVPPMDLMPRGQGLRTTLLHAQF